MPGTRIHWTNLTFVIAAHGLAVWGVVHMALWFSWWTLALGLVWWALCGLSITAGYHRLFAHRAYSASLPLRALYLLFGAASVQNSALSWAADHRAHHADTDGESDPYSIVGGFWWAHIGWVLRRSAGGLRRGGVRDLEADALLRLQHRYYVPLAVLFGAAIPAAIGSAWGDALGAMLVAGWLRLVLQWHATFSVNSLAHCIGRQPYSTANSARDSFLVALLTLGEGYHNFHHRFQIDYRNGVRWYHFDPTKWWVWSMARLGLARGLRRVGRANILAARQANHGAQRPVRRATPTPTSTTAVPNAVVHE